MTFSLVGRCDRTGAVGAVIASASMAVAARCAAVRAGAGAVCSQSTTDPRLREALLETMAGGAAASDALAALTARTGDIAYRQLAVVDAAGGSACYSGELALGDAADVCATEERKVLRTGEDYIESLRDSQEMSINSQQIGDIATHPAFAPMVSVRARIYIWPARPGPPTC